ncbi:MAG: hypothetical protein ACPG52_05960 [Cognaticolwellia sp.]
MVFTQSNGDAGMINQIAPSNIKYCGNMTTFDNDMTTFISSYLIDKVVIEHILYQLGYKITEVEDYYWEDIENHDPFNAPATRISTNLPKSVYDQLID